MKLDQVSRINKLTKLPMWTTLAKGQPKMYLKGPKCLEVWRGISLVTFLLVLLKLMGLMKKQKVTVVVGLVIRTQTRVCKKWCLSWRYVLLIEWTKFSPKKLVTDNTDTLIFCPIQRIHSEHTVFLVMYFQYLYAKYFKVSLKSTIST